MPVCHEQCLLMLIDGTDSEAIAETKRDFFSFYFGGRVYIMDVYKDNSH